MTRTVTETLTFGVHDGFDLAVHGTMVEKLLDDEHGPGWHVTDVTDYVVTAQRTVTVEEPAPLTAEDLVYGDRLRQLNDAFRQIRHDGYLGNLLVGHGRHDHLTWPLLNVNEGTIEFKVVVPFVSDGRRYNAGHIFSHRVIPA